MSELSDKLARILVASGMEDMRQETVEELRALEADNTALCKRVEGLERVLKAAQADVFFERPPHDYGWTVSKEYASMRAEFKDAIVDATLISAGYDPDDVAERSFETARKALAADLDKLPTQQKPTEEAMEEA